MISYKTIKTTILSAAAMIVGCFDKGVEGVISDFTKLDAKLSKLSDKLEAKYCREADIIDNSHRAELDFISKQDSIRFASAHQRSLIEDEARRVARIRGKLKALTA